ncbi:LuxR C-terminal-related transcriptional regulator [Streptomyces sp. NPDC046821]|uniref:LuxR C-terminal-related transcriptional regulator n=1 Tax=Streptomyces sp. NPDC046821 TaxID=3154702 RepID=UPI0033F07C58
MMADSRGAIALAGDLVRAGSFDELVRRLYAGIDDLFGPVCVGFDLLDPDTHEVRRTSARGVSDYFMARYDRFARRADPVLNFAIDHRVVTHNLSMMSSAEWRSLVIYQEVFSLHRMTSLVYAPVVADDRVVATLNLGREDGSAGFDAEQLEQAQALADLLGAVLRAQRKADALARRADQYAAALDLCGEAMVVTDLREGERHVNPSAAAILAGRSPAEPSLDEELALHRARGAGGVEGASALVKRSVTLEDSDTLVTFLHAEQGGERLPEWLLQRLTPREADVAALVARGCRDGEIAQHLVLSTHTVKGHLREIYRKLEVRSRVELTRLASGQEH